MNKPKVKEQYIGASTHLASIGRITIREDHAELLLIEGHFDKLEGVQRAEMLKPIKPAKEEKLEDKTIHELRKLAKGLDGFNLSLKKIELISLINAASK